MQVRRTSKLLGLLLGLSLPVSATAQAKEPPAREAAAIADADRTCAPEKAAVTPELREYLSPDYFKNMRTLDGELLTTDQLRKDVESSRPNFNSLMYYQFCLSKVALRHSMNGVPGYDNLPGIGGSVAVAQPAKAAVWSLSESLSSLSINGSNAPAPPGKDAHIIAADGKSAMDCVRLMRVSSGDSKLLGTGGRVLSNQCSDAVEAGWCYSPGDCDSESGSSWTIRPGRSWPIKSAGDVRWAACHGANTQSFVKGSHGLRYYCTAPK